MRIWLLLVVSVVVSSCSSDDAATSTLLTPATAPTTLPVIGEPPFTLPEPQDLPPPLNLEPSELDFGDFRPLIGRWELMSFPGESFSAATPHISFHVLQRARKERISYMAGYGGICNSHGGTFLVDGDQLRVYGWNFTLMGCLGDIPRLESVFGSWFSLAETWSREGDELSITNTQGVTAVFRLLTQTGNPDGSEDAMETVGPRLHFVDDTGFLLQIQEQSSADTYHGAETVSWLAWSAGSDDGSLDGFAWETALVESPDTHKVGQKVAPAVSAFAQSYETPCLVADVDTFHDIRPTSLRYRKLTDSGVELVVDGEVSPQVVDGPRLPPNLGPGHVDEMVALVVADCGADQGPDGVELGRVEELTADWQRVELAQSFVDPVVVAGPASLNGGDPGVVEVRNVSASSFEIRFHEWDYLDGPHPNAEAVSYLAAERGVTALPSGGLIEVGTTTATSTFAEVPLTGPFDGTPAVATTVQR